MGGTGSGRRASGSGAAGAPRASAGAVALRRRQSGDVGRATSAGERSGRARCRRAGWRHRPEVSRVTSTPTSTTSTRSCPSWTAATDRTRRSGSATSPPPGPPRHRAGQAGSATARTRGGPRRPIRRARRPARSRPAAAQPRPQPPERPAPCRCRAWSAAPPGPRRRRPLPGTRPISAHPPIRQQRRVGHRGGRASVPAASTSAHAFHSARPSANRVRVRTRLPARPRQVSALQHLAGGCVLSSWRTSRQRGRTPGCPDPVSYGLMSRPPTVRNGSHRTRRCRRYGRKI